MTAPDQEPDDYTAPLNPVEIEAAIQECSARIANGVKWVTKAERQMKATTRAYDRAFAQAFLRHQGPQTEKKYAAELDETVMAARDAMDEAFVLYKHALRTAEAVERELGSLQSINKSIVAMYGATTGMGR